MGQPRIVIVGAGFGGLRAARSLANQPVDVLLIDQHNFHCFQPLLYQVATAGLEPEQIAYPIRAIIRPWRNVRFLLARVERIDRMNRLLQTSAGSVSYDHLIIAAGGATNDFGLPGVADHGFGLKSLEDAVRLRNHLLTIFEKASYEQQLLRRAALHTFVIVGGGPTGVEMAGALRELVKHVLTRDFPDLRERDVRVILLEATDTLLAMLPANLQRKTIERLRSMGVEVRLKAAVTSITADSVVLKDGTTIPSHTLIWAAGIRGVELAQTLELALSRGGRMAVNPDLSLPDDPAVWVIGDLAYLETNGEAYPQIAPVAIQQGEQVAANILARLRKTATRPFHYRNQGSMATIGRNAAVARVYGLSFWGFPAWVVWLVVHLMGLIGFRNRLVVLINWAYNYLFYERAIRIISAPARSLTDSGVVQSNND